jgi:hypothetical protein
MFGRLGISAQGCFSKEFWVEVAAEENVSGCLKDIELAGKCGCDGAARACNLGNVRTAVNNLIPVPKQSYFPVQM